MRVAAASLVLMTVVAVCTSGAAAPPHMAASQSVAASSRSAAWESWGARLDNARYQPATDARLGAENVAKLHLKWAFGYPGATLAFSQPSVSNAVLFVGSESGAVYALDRMTGRVRWSFKAPTAVRTGFAVGPDGPHPAGSLIYFGDQHGAVYALSAATGELRWQQQADGHPAAMITGTPQLWRDRLFVPVTSYEENYAPDPRYPCCTFRGSVVAYEALTGRVIWKTYTLTNQPQKTQLNKAGTQLWGPSGAGVWSTPALDSRRQILYAATGNNYSGPVTGSSDAVLAMSLAAGKILWVRQLTSGDVYNGACEDFLDPTHANCPPAHGPDFDFGAPPMLVTQAPGRQILIAAQKSGVVYGLDPANQGAVLWHTRIARGGPLGGVEWGAASDGENVYAAISDCEWKTFERVKDGKTTSYVDLDPDKGGGLAALRVSDGRKVWEAPAAAACAGREHCSPAQLAAVTVIPGVIFSGSLDGHLRAYSRQSGQVLWDFDTAREFSTVNGVPAHGGSLNGGGAVIADGMLFVNSGYSRFGEAGGNVLLAFAVDGG